MQYETLSKNAFTNKDLSEAAASKKERLRNGQEVKNANFSLGNDTHREEQRSINTTIQSPTQPKNFGKQALMIRHTGLASEQVDRF